MMNQNATMAKRKQLLDFIDKVSFAVNDITLYLDTHPKDKDAIDYFNHYKELRLKAMKEYEKLYGPLMVDFANPDDVFTWALMPAPWEGGMC
ncbi:MAG: spore coat protein CotJB [Roseburia sp.]|uniref:spore coat protein CotJB n=1 Tax=Roseburia hominis TaxID=301301 RepID=UPI002A87F604|nr:spore coat protein CotJB [Lachnospiraceae bacterium]